MDTTTIHRSGRLRILVLGYIIRGPMGGVTWPYLQYVLGLHQMGHDVYYLEDSGDTRYACYDPERNAVDTDPSYGLQYAQRVFGQVGLAEKWAYYDYHQQQWQGPLASKVMDKIAGADLLLNLSGANPIRPWLAEVPRRVLVDPDPAFTQVDILTDPGKRQFAAQHTDFFTFATNIGNVTCKMPDDGFSWQPTRQPVCLDAWKIVPSPPSAPWTTVMQWDSYQVRDYLGQTYGMKSWSFQPFIRLPQWLPHETFELALGNAKSSAGQLRQGGWRVVNPLVPTRTPWTYQQYIQASKGEWSVAKHGYVVSHGGWFSERSTGYLASGKPVVVQETGFSEVIETGRGLLTFRTAEEAVEAIQEVNKDYVFHCKEARRLVEENFEATQVLETLLNNVS